jgi:hypothetical protein
MHHYRCVKCFLPTTRAEINADTVAFFPHRIPIPKVTTEDFLQQAALDIISILSSPKEENCPVPKLEHGDPTRNALLKIALLLNRTSKTNNDFKKDHHQTINIAKQLHPCTMTPSSSVSPVPPTTSTPSRAPTKQSSLFTKDKSSPSSTKPQPMDKITQLQHMLTQLTRVITNKQ